MQWNSANASLAALTALAALALIASGFGGCGDNGSGPANDSPAITSLAASADTVDPTARVTITCSASDLNGDALVYTWGQEAGEISGAGASVAWMAPEAGGSYSIWVAVTDGKGGAAADTVEVSVTEGILLVQTKDGLIAVTLAGVTSLFYDTTREVEVLGDRVFIGPSGDILELDHEGSLVGSIPRATEIPGATTFVVLPDAGFAFVGNRTDSIYFMDPAGVFVTAGPIATESPSLQNTKGLSVGNRLIMVDSGPDHVLAYDLDTYEGSLLRDLIDMEVQPFDADYSGGTFYVAGSIEVIKFTETGAAEPVCALPAGNGEAIAVVGSYAYACASYGGMICKIDIYTEQLVVFAEGLNYPTDIEYLRLQP